jgi:hypothetical protein
VRTPTGYLDPSPVVVGSTMQELASPVQMFPNLALRDNIEAWAQANAPHVLGADGHVKPSPEEPVHPPTTTTAAAVVLTPSAATGSSSAAAAGDGVQR